MSGNFDWSSMGNQAKSSAELSDLFAKHNIKAESIDENGNTYLHFFIKCTRFSQNDTIKVTKNLLELGLDPDIKNKRDETFLHLAVARRLNEVIDILLEHGADVNAIDNYGNSIAHLFVDDEYDKYMKLDESSISHVRALVDHGLEKYFNFGNYGSPSRLSVEKDDADFVEWLISKGLDFDGQNKKGESALHLAIKYNLQHILPCLLKHSKNIDFVSEHDKRTLLHSFIKTSNMCKFSKRRVWCANFSNRYTMEIMKILLERGVSVDDVDAHGLTAIHMATDAVEELDIVLMLIDSFTKLSDECGGSLLHSIVRNSSSNASKSNYYNEILQALIAKGVDVDSKDKHQGTPIFYAVKEQNQRVVELLRDGGADFSVITSGGQNLLHVLANNANCKSEALFDFLINNGCDADAKDEYGKSPLHVAVVAGNVTMIEKLLAYGVEVNSQENVNDWTPLHSATADRRGLVKIAELLLDNGAKVNDKNRWNGRPLHLAADLKNGRSMLKLLLSRGAQVDARDNSGNSALARTFFSNCPDNAEELLDYGADISDKCILRYLWSGCNDPVGRILRSHSIKLKAANLPCSDSYTPLARPKDNRRFYETCKKEIETLKSTFIDSNTSLYQWLHMDVISSFIYIPNEKFLKVVGSSTLRKEFPEYATVILARYREIAARKFLLRPAKEVWLKLTRVVLPDICIDCIFSNLSNADLIDIIEVVEPGWLE